MLGEYTIRIKPAERPFSLSLPGRTKTRLCEVVKKQLNKLESQSVILLLDKPTEHCCGHLVPKSFQGYQISVQLTQLIQVSRKGRHMGHVLIRLDEGPIFDVFHLSVRRQH